MRRLILTILVILCNAPALATQPEVRGTLPIAGKIVPLPPGSWRVLNTFAEQVRTSDLRQATTLHRALLVQEHNGVAAAVIIVSAATEVSTTWQPQGICTSTSNIRRHVEIAVRGSLDCRGLSNQTSGVGTRTPEWLLPLYRIGEGRPGWIPQRWISASVLLSEQMHYLSVEYRYAPSVFAPQSARNAANWSDGVRSSEQTDFVERLDRFSLAARAQLRHGLYGRQPTEPLAAPF